ncbi:MAG: polyprenyl synthetase family protein [Nocardioidaceae bacterium]|nr:polyprenyl synthetase family protein [Nocardioidaceae bacterium]
MTATSFGIPRGDATLEAVLRAGLEAVEVGLTAAVSSEAEFVNEAARHLLDAGGKRFRPLLVLLAAQFGVEDADAEAVVAAALVVELTHVATLYHDDVMDEARLRRGAPSANARFDNSVAILTGDFLFAQASDIVAGLGPEAVRIQARTFARLVQGQIAETRGPAPGQDPLDHYLSVVADKTGSLIAASARLGALTAGCSRHLQGVLTAFGERIGTAFQLSDDILDVASAATQSGKTPGTDLREGVATLPVLLFEGAPDPADGRLRELLAGDLGDDALLGEALTLLRGHPAMGQSRSYVVDRAEEARALLEQLPAGPARDALDDLCDLVVTRTA